MGGGLMDLVGYVACDYYSAGWSDVERNFDSFKKFWESKRECSYCKKELKSVDDIKICLDLYCHSECIPEDWDQKKCKCGNTPLKGKQRRLAFEIIDTKNQDLIDHAVLIAASEGIFDCVKLLCEHASENALIRAYSRAKITVEEKETQWPFPRNEMAFKYDKENKKYIYIPADHEKICEFLKDKVIDQTDWFYYTVQIHIPRFMELKERLIEL